MTGKPIQSQRAENHWLVDAGQIRALASPVRQDILDHLSRKPSASVADLAGALAVRPTALYRHMEILADAGLIIDAGTRETARRAERLYASCARRLRLEKAYADEGNSEALLQVFGALSRQLERDLANALTRSDAVSSGPARNLAFARVIGAPSARDLKAINKKLEEISAILRASENADAPLVGFGWALSPLARDGGATD